MNKLFFGATMLIAGLVNAQSIPAGMQKLTQAGGALYVGETQKTSQNNIGNETNPDRKLNVNGRNIIGGESVTTFAPISFPTGTNRFVKVFILGGKGVQTTHIKENGIKTTVRLFSTFQAPAGAVPGGSK